MGVEDRQLGGRGGQRRERKAEQGCPGAHRRAPVA
jgi:hypothetical protein